MERDGTRNRIVDAAARLLHEHGAGAVTTRAVAQAAGVQAPALYRLFGDKDGLLDAVAERVMADYVATKAASAPRTADPVADLRAGWRLHIDFALANPALYPLLVTASPGRRSPAVDAGTELLLERVHRIAAEGLLRVDVRRALEIIHAAGTGTILALLRSPEGERDPGLADAMFDAVAGSILSRAPAVPETGVAAVTVAFAAAVPGRPGLSDAERGLMAEWLARSLRS